ncbi:hypothetical protein B0O99DRAFT_579764 [Bisporella sp. PMI_857]|nr:hypothetical protein B0O99DRAFT_579764 [Bisporella sp. PMI_857]
MASTTRRGEIPPDENLGITFLVLTCVLTVLSTIMTILRCWVRKVNRCMGWDDYLMIVVSVMAIARTGLQAASVHHGNGRHVQYLSGQQYRWIVMSSLFTQLLLFPTICLLKVSICLLLLRIKDTPGVKIIIYVIIGGLALTNGVPEFVLLAECRPFKAYWEPKSGKCWDARVRIYSIYIQVGYSVITDLICSLMPVFVVYNLKIPIREKILICSLMGLGLIATACAAIRASSLGTKITDLSWDYCIAAIWANTELHLGIIAANLACGRAIFMYFRNGCVSVVNSQKRLSTHNHSRTGYFKTTELSGAKSNEINIDTLASKTAEDIEIPEYRGIKVDQEFTFHETRQSVERKRSTDIPLPMKSHDRDHP